MEGIKKHWKEILFALLVIFSLNKCTVACNRDTKINKQQAEILQKDSIIRAQSDSLSLLNVRWDENQRGQASYQNLATGTKQELTNTINQLEIENGQLKNNIQNLTKENNKLKSENKQLKEQLN